MARYKDFRLARLNCLAASRAASDFKPDKRAELRKADALDRAAAIREAKSFKERMRVGTPDGNGKVIGVNTRSGSIEVRVEGFTRPRAYPATSLTKL